MFYHGTTKGLWAKVNASGLLYVTNSLKEASIYAGEASETEWDDEIHVAGGNEPIPVIIGFSIETIMALAATRTVVLEPDWGWVDALENDLKNQGKTLSFHLTWEESLSKVGSFCITGFAESLKALGQEIAESETAA